MAIGARRRSKLGVEAPLWSPQSDPGGEGSRGWERSQVGGTKPLGFFIKEISMIFKAISKERCKIHTGKLVFFPFTFYMLPFCMYLPWAPWRGPWGIWGPSHTPATPSHAFNPNTFKARSCSMFFCNRRSQFKTIYV